MIIHTVRVGPIETNCYLVEDETTKEALIVDPGDEAEKILEVIKKNGLKPRYIVNTHGHFDHITGNLKLKEKTGAPVLSHELDAFLIALTLPLPPDNFLKDGDRLKVGRLTFTVIHTPGHTPGGICLYCEKEKTLFSGDTLFYGTTGRTDLPYASEKDMGISFKKLLTLPDETKVYPGHGQPTTIGQEKLINDF
jgi:glyoxylase-like metal-dependent hydrolase (beta-lactamase superfamily II)